jgi:DNA (cytosine-5)-methyltransferase 1
VNELSLFSGAGGGLLGTMLLRFTPVGYVEWDDYCQRVLAARIRDGILPDAPIFGDIKTFIDSGSAELYRGVTDVITGGFPCQAWSNAACGKNNAENKWPEMLKVIEIVQPPFVFAENVDEGAIVAAQEDLAIRGYKTRRCRLSAKDLGADHIRKRYWLLAYPNDKGKLLREINAKMERVPKFCASVWETYPEESRMDDGVAYKMDRFKAIGNGQVPAVVATAWRVLTQD